MTFLELDVVIWVVLVFYFIGMLLIGWWCKRSIKDQEGYLLGNRKFGPWMMVMHAFGAGTGPGDTAGTVSKTVAGGASGIWVSWMWMFGTPIYWLIAPVIRRMRCLTMADFFQERFGRSAAVLYTVVTGLGMTIYFAGVLLATTRTVQGMMGKAGPDVGVDWWFFGILTITTVTFTLYGYWGGIIAAIRTDMVQGWMIILLSFLAIPMALNMPEVAGMAGLKETLAAASDKGYLSLFNSSSFKLTAVIVLSINGPLTALSFPHLMSVCAAGESEWEGRVGFAGGNMLKRFCTIGWSLLGLCWLAYLLQTGATIHPDAAFGDSIRALLPPLLQGIMLSCIMAASMSSGDAFQVTVAGLYTQSIYRPFINPDADEDKQMQMTRLTGIVIVGIALIFAILMRHDFVKSILAYFNILSIVGISSAMGILWRRMNAKGVFTSVIFAGVVNILTWYVWPCPPEWKFSLPIVAGVLGGIVGSLFSAPPDPAVIETFFRKIHVPIGQEDKLALPLDEAVPKENRLLTGGGLFVVKPSRQTWVGFLVVLAACVACVLIMLWLLK